MSEKGLWGCGPDERGDVGGLVKGRVGCGYAGEVVGCLSR